MTIRISEQEYEAIKLAIRNLNVNDDTIVNNLSNIINKYNQARIKANELNEARAYIRKKNPYMTQAKLDKLSREFIRERKNK